MNSNHTYLALINLDSSLKKDENYYPQKFLKECEYIKKKQDRDRVTFSSDSDEEFFFL